MPAAHALSTFVAREPPVHICSMLPASGSIKGYLWIHFSPDTIPQERGKIQNSLPDPTQPSSLSYPGHAELSKQMGLTMPRGLVALGPDRTASFKLNDPSARGTSSQKFSSASKTRRSARGMAEHGPVPQLWFALNISEETCLHSKVLPRPQSQVSHLRSAASKTSSRLGLLSADRSGSRCCPGRGAWAWPWHPSTERRNKLAMSLWESGQIFLCCPTLQIIFLPQNIFPVCKSHHCKK